MLKVKGILREIGDFQQVSDNFSKIQILIDIESERKQTIPFVLTGERCSLVDNFEEGEIVVVYFKLKGTKRTKHDGQVIYFSQNMVKNIVHFDPLYPPLN
jgi:hypothetical protein